MDVEKIVLDYINSKSEIPNQSKNEQLNYDYLSSGSIDSMQMVEMIEFLESKFKMRFNSEDFQLNKFPFSWRFNRNYKKTSITR